MGGLKNKPRGWIFGKIKPPGGAKIDKDDSGAKFTDIWKAGNFRAFLAVTQG